MTAVQGAGGPHEEKSTEMDQIVKKKDAKIMELTGIQVKRKFEKAVCTACVCVSQLCAETVTLNQSDNL